MIERGYTEEEISKVWGENFFRVFKQVEMLANQRN
jgi:membrane dipeptidase